MHLALDPGVTAWHDNEGASLFTRTEYEPNVMRYWGRDPIIYSV